MKEIKSEKSYGKIFLSHLEDLRGVLLKSLTAVISGVVVSFVFAPKLFNLLLIPYVELSRQQQGLSLAGNFCIKSLGPSEVFLASMKLAFISGVVLAMPVILYQLWKFILPGLVLREQKFLRLVLFLSPFLFSLGAMFAYTIVFPLALKFLWSYTLRMGVYPDWTIAHYMNFIISFLFAFGVAFELPIVIVLLAKSGLVTPQNLAKKRKYAIVLIFLFSALLTPPDVVSQLLLGIPMLVLYELSILMAINCIRR
ncbi:twin-arginine translocase subunit TatC [Candidatus Pacearchaeota archaeon]|nr:twin-arginine translocase subunit TatC [Candidatus Pacearchaeota archaeon]